MKKVYLRTENMGSTSKLFVGGMGDSVHEIDLANPPREQLYNRLRDKGKSHIEALTIDAAYQCALAAYEGPHDRNNLPHELGFVLGTWAAETLQDTPKEKKALLLVHNRETVTQYEWPHVIMRREDYQPPLWAPKAD